MILNYQLFQTEIKKLFWQFHKKDIPKKVLKNMKELQEKLNQEELEKNRYIKHNRQQSL